MARREMNPVHKVVMTEGKRNIIQQLLQEYYIETAEDIQDALKDLLGGTIKEMIEAEMEGCIIPASLIASHKTADIYNNSWRIFPQLS